MDKRFEKMRARSLKKGKGELTLEAFLDNEERDCDRSEKLKFIYFLMPVIITAIACLYSSFLNGFSSISNSIFYDFVILIVSSVVVMLSYKDVKKSINYRRAWINAKREEIKTKQENSETD